MNVELYTVGLLFLIKLYNLFSSLSLYALLESMDFLNAEFEYFKTLSISHKYNSLFVLFFPIENLINATSLTDSSV